MVGIPSANLRIVIDMPRERTPVTSTPNSPIASSSRADQYYTEMDYYIQMITNTPPRSENARRVRQNILLRLMIDIGFFENVSRELNLPEIDRIEIDDWAAYDPRNMLHRFMLLFLNYREIEIDDFEYFEALLPYPGPISIPAIVALTMTDFTFFRFHYRSDSNMPNPITNSIDEDDFVVNGQKMRLCLRSIADPELTRYTQALRIDASSQRGTNQRFILQFVRGSSKFYFKRIRMNHPIHGFKFVQIPSGHLLIKEIH